METCQIFFRTFKMTKTFYELSTPIQIEGLCMSLAPVVLRAGLNDQSLHIEKTVGSEQNQKQSRLFCSDT